MRQRNANVAHGIRTCVAIDEKTPIEFSRYLSRTNMCARWICSGRAVTCDCSIIIDRELELEYVREMNKFISRTYAKVIHECELVSKHHWEMITVQRVCCMHRKAHYTKNSRRSNDRIIEQWNMRYVIRLTRIHRVTCARWTCSSRAHMDMIIHDCELVSKHNELVSYLLIVFVTL